MAAISWAQALGWRLRRQLLDPVESATDGPAGVAEVVRRLTAVPAHPEPAAELAVRTRLARSSPGDLATALAEGRIIKSYAFRGATHLLTPEQGAAYLALRAASKMWELPSWQKFYALTPKDWPRLRELVRGALADGPLTVRELGAAVSAETEFAQLRPVFESGAATLIKPFTWQGDMSFGPSRNGQATFQRLDDNPRWTGLPEPDDAARQAVELYLSAYGPATRQHLSYWLGSGLGAGRGLIAAGIAALGDRIATIDVEGEPAMLLAADRDDLAASAPSTVVRLLPGYDQWVLGPGTADPHVVPPARRALVSRGANLIIVGGVVSGTWSLDGGLLRTNWFPEANSSAELPSN